MITIILLIINLYIFSICGVYGYIDRYSQYKQKLIKTNIDADLKFLMSLFWPITLIICFYSIIGKQIRNLGWKISDNHIKNNIKKLTNQNKIRIQLKQQEKELQNIEKTLEQEFIELEQEEKRKKELQKNDSKIKVQYK